MQSSQQIFVVGHINPDTDTIASAIGYAWLLNERDSANAIAARAGACNPQTVWALKKLDIEMPVLITDASPRFGSVARRLDTTTPDRPLREAWVIASRTGGIAPVVNTDGSPFGLINGQSFFKFLERHVGPQPEQQEKKISEILDVPCHQAANQDVPRYRASIRIRDVISRILRQEGDEFWVVDEKGSYVGICRQRDLLNPPRLKLILVDHNEPQQAISSLEEAELIEILDHHRLGNPSTHRPIKFTVDIVGSTSTLVSERITDSGLSAPPHIAGMLLAGLLADTLRLTSPTTTPRDHLAAERLARWAINDASPLKGETIESFGKQLLAAGTGLGVRSPKEIVNGDLKIYQSGGYDFAIAQVEVNDLQEITDHLDDLRSALVELCSSKGLDFAMLMITGVVLSSSRLLIVKGPPLLDDLPYPPLPDGTRLAEGVVSRKKQLLPVIFGLLDG